MKAISPVIATVIIVAVTIAIAVAVALWLTGMVSPFTTVENLQIVSAIAGKDNNVFTVNVTIKNTGTSTATIDGVFINGKYFQLDYTDTNSNPLVQKLSNDIFQAASATESLESGKDITLRINLAVTGMTFSSGQMVEIKFHTASGKEYPKTVTLP